MKNKVAYKNFIKKFIVFALIALFLIPTDVLAQTISQEKSAEYYVEQLTPYLDRQGNTLLTFDKKNAIKDNIDKDIIAIGENLEEMSISYYQYYEEGITPYGIPIWGNWCGPGYGSGRPIDVLDEGCRQHDVCYGKNKPARFPCHCDRILISYINQNYHKMTGTEKAMGRTVQAWFILQKAYCTEVAS